ncbi:MAG: CehA/McbA family metallohydrolase [Candidatus Cloacimonetes bacterium]|nr:CehA/McbA family metallohydrolase [Candidatus Cloacimonadota bacterium]
MRQKSILGKNYNELTGAIHIHTEFSHDCSVAMEDIIKYAKKSDLDYLTINDHNNFHAEEKLKTLDTSDVIFIIGAEISDYQDHNHYLIFKTDEIIRKGKAEDYVKHYAEAGAMGFIAHPIDRRKDYSFKQYPWTARSCEKFTGMEIWNFVSNWLRHLNPKVNGLLWVLFPKLCVGKPSRDTLEMWDNYNLRGLKKPAIGSIDAHTVRLRRFGLRFKILKHKQLFKTIRTNVLIPTEKQINQDSILDALAKGNSYIANYTMGEPRNFYAGISTGEENGIMGDSVLLTDNTKIYFRLPKIARVSLFHNGKKIDTKFDEKGEFQLSDTGFYRLEILRFGYGWIYTNNFYVH